MPGGERCGDKPPDEQQRRRADKPQQEKQILVLWINKPVQAPSGGHENKRRQTGNAEIRDSYRAFMFQERLLNLGIVPHGLRPRAVSPIPRRCLQPMVPQKFEHDPIPDRSATTLAFAGCLDIPNASPLRAPSSRETGYAWSRW